MLSKTIKVRFDANVSNELDWEFNPAIREVELKIGEKSQVSYIAKNVSPFDSYGTATFNVSPGAAGIYFNKIECFCFTEQTLEPGQQVNMPVVYYVDPAILEDEFMADVEQITLSYTFHKAIEPVSAQEPNT